MVDLQHTQTVDVETGMLLLGKYKVLEKLGQGGMGAVYRCLDTMGGIEVAVKTIPAELARSHADMKELLANFQLTATLIHQNIAACLNLEEDSVTGSYYMVMELVEGRELRQWLRQRHNTGGLALEEALPILRQVASALDYAHAMGIMHRDIKPGNIMVKADGTVKVLDFGLAARISNGAESFNARSGTSMYMAPEQWQRKPQGAATDQYALAVTAYEMLSGHLPFDCMDAAVMLNMVLNVEPPPIEGMPKLVNEALARGLAKSPDMRFASCGDFVNAISRGVAKAQPRRFSWFNSLLVICLVLLLCLSVVYVFLHFQQASLGKPPVVSNVELKPQPTMNPPSSEEDRLGDATEMKMPAQDEQLETRQASLLTPVVMTGGPIEGETAYLVVDLVTGSHRHSAIPPDLDNDICRTRELWLRHISKGVFIMGLSGASSKVAEMQRKVTLTRDFYIGLFELTQRQWQLVMGQNPALFKDDAGRHPVEKVSYNDICEGDGCFLRRLVDKTGLAFDLPTEAQWEYVCRAGTPATEETGFYKPGQDKFNCPELGEVAWYGGNSEKGYELSEGEDLSKWRKDLPQNTLGGHHPVGKKRPNAWGIYDMHGNVTEWCRDWFTTKLGGEDSIDPKGPDAGEEGMRLLRGGQCFSGAGEWYHRARPGFLPNRAMSFIGFRLVCLP